MKTCRTYRVLFMDAFYHELDRVQMREFEEHLKQCAACRTEYKKMKSALEIMSQKKETEPDPVFWNGYWTRLMKRMETGESLNHRRMSPGSLGAIISHFVSGWGYRMAGAAALITIGIFIGYLHFGPTAQNIISPEGLAESQAYKIRQAAINQQALQYIERSKILLLGLVNLDTDRIDPSAMDFSRQKEISRDLITEAVSFKKQLKGADYLRLLNLISELEMLMLQICNYEEKFDLPAIELIKNGVENQAILLKINIAEMMLSDQDELQESEGGRKNNINL